MRVILTILDDITETSMPFNEFVLYRATHNKDENHVLIVCSENKRLPEVTIPVNLSIIYVGKNIYKMRKTIKSLMEKYRKENIDYLIHMHQVKSSFLAQIAMIGTEFRKKTLFTVHSTFSGYAIHNKILSFFDAFMASRITCVSNISYEDYPTIIKKIKKNRIQAVQNGVDIERINQVLSEDETSNKKEYIEFIYVARIIPIKNHKFLINVLKNTKSNVKFVFVGNDSEAGDLKELCKEYGLLNRVEFTGLISRNDVFKRIQKSDVYISSSVLEGMPVSVLEAACCGLPIIVSDIPQHSELARKNNFISLLPFEIEKWKNEIDRYASMAEEKRKSIGKQCCEYVHKNFSLKNMHKKYEDIYISLIEK